MPVSFAANSHKVLPVESCLLQDEVLDKTMQAVRAAANACRYQPYDEDKGTGLVRHCLLRRGVATGQVMVVLVTAQPVLPGAKNFVKALLAETAQRGVTVTTVVQNVNSRKTSVVLGEAEKVLYGKGFILDTLCGKTYAISPRSFYQVNPAQTAVLYGLAVEAAKLTGKGGDHLIAVVVRLLHAPDGVHRAVFAQKSPHFFFLLFQLFGIIQPQQGAAAAIFVTQFAIHGSFCPYYGKSSRESKDPAVKKKTAKNAPACGRAIR